LAEKFFNQALLIAPQDPFVLHELGVVAYQSQDYDGAEKHFKDALNIIKYKKEMTHLPEKWEPLLNNMGHVLRKLKKYEEALEFHKQAMVLSPQNPSSYAAIGFVYSLMCNWNEAVEYFHKALGLKRDDPFSTSMLTHAIEHLINGMTPLNEECPPYESSTHINTFLEKTVTENGPTTGDKLTTPEEVVPLPRPIGSLLSNEAGTESSLNLDVEMDISTE
jgi:tetratricopeptide (TPR) repeat protein